RRIIPRGPLPLHLSTAMTNCQLTLPEHANTLIKSDQLPIYTQTNKAMTNMSLRWVMMHAIDERSLDLGAIERVLGIDTAD
ncbi:MAG: hypothetical protein ACREXS_02730, partial [Gammaproteobacteria bacterium]